MTIPNSLTQSYLSFLIGIALSSPSLLGDFDDKSIAAEFWNSEWYLTIRVVIALQYP